jgi:hypothetical protein
MSQNSLRVRSRDDHEARLARLGVSPAGRLEDLDSRPEAASISRTYRPDG